MGWKPSHPHDSDDPRIGRHIDAYHTDEDDKRDRPHHEDMKVSYDEDKPLVQDVIPPDKK